MKLIEILILIVPVTAWALWNDRNGDDHKKGNYNDISWETWFILTSSAIVYWIEDYNWLIYFKSLAISITGFGLIFPYAFNWYWLYHQRSQLTGLRRFIRAMSMLSDTAIPDKWKWWRSLGWFGRLLVYVVLFTLALIWFL